MDSNLEQFKAVTGCDDTRARFFLDAAGGNVQQAIEAFYSGSAMDGAESDDDEFVDAVDGQAAASSFKTTTTSSSFTTSSSTSRPPTTTYSSSSTTSSSSSRPNTSAAAKPRIATLGDLGRRGEEEEGGKRGKNEYFTGGGKNSGIAIQGRDDKEETQRIFKAARDAGARTEEEDQAARHSHSAGGFGGLGFRLGESASVPSMAVGQSLSEQRDAAPKMRKVVVTFWKGGFSVDNGIDPPTLRPLLDPANRAFLTSIQSGRIPDELVALGEEIDLEMRDQRDQDFVPPKPKQKPFAGAGFSLAAAGGAGGAAAAAAAAAAAVPVPAREVSVDPSKPTTKLQIRLADGTRMVASFNHTHTVGDVRSFVAAARPGTKPFVLMTAHPSATLADDSITLEAAKLLNSVVLQKFV